MLKRKPKNPPGNNRERTTRAPRSHRRKAGGLIGRRLAFVVLLVVVACARPPKFVLPSSAVVPQGGNIVVTDFSVPPGTPITNYTGDPGAVGQRLAQEIVLALRHKGMTADVVARDAVPEAQLIVTGRITRVYGGSQSKRALWGMGIGHGTFAAAGEVKSANGTIVATFTDQRGSVGRIGYGGGSNEFVVELCVKAVGADIAEMIATGNYRGNSVVQVQRQPSSRVLAPGVETHQDETADRLRELESLRDKGFVTEREYEKKRREILDQL